jgi:hypothetical protein
VPGFPTLPGLPAAPAPLKLIFVTPDGTVKVPGELKV